MHTHSRANRIVLTSVLFFAILAVAIAYELHQSAVLVLGHDAFDQVGAQGADTSDDSMWSPSQVATDGTRLIVADQNNYRVLVWNTIPVADG